MLEKLNLTGCADVMIGGEMIKGISGGQRKRTSVGVELVTNPKLVFLDEPTSGLDSDSALSCIQLLKSIAKSGTTVLCTIHQPSSEVFSLFDNVILMKDGRIMYQGEVDGVVEGFSNCGFPPPVFQPMTITMSYF
jgi:ABC-type multidrug transport system ATPase subunit